MKVSLFLTEGPEAGKSFEFGESDTFLVGRTRKAHLRFDLKADRHISRTHFLLEIRPPRCIVTDLNSSNGTYVNDKRIQKTDLKDGDVIRVGKTRIEVKIEGKDEDRGHAVHCLICGKNVTAEVADIPPEEMADLKYTCHDCEKTKAITDTYRFVLQAQKKKNERYACYQCDKDLTKEANLDGFAAELFNAMYLCDRCARGAHETAKGSKYLGDYYVLRELGRGGMGIVYKGVHKRNRRICAVKMILPELVRNEYARKVFEREIAVQSRVVHPNLVRVLDQDRHKNIPFFVTEYLGGGDVKNLVAWEFRGPLEPRLSCIAVIQILRGLQALHNAGFIHRDLKPSNFLLDRSYKEKEFFVKIADYGLAKPFESSGHSMFEYTREGIAAGSYVFIPPEQITNYKYVKPPVDVYAVGTSLYYMLTAKYSVDFPDPTLDTNKKARHPVQVVLEDPPVPILERSVEIPESLAKVVDKAVEKDSDRRYQSADAFRADLEKVFEIEGWEPFFRY